MGSIQKDLSDLIYDVEKVRKSPANPEFGDPRFLQERSRLEAFRGKRAGSRWDRIHRESQQVDGSLCLGRKRRCENARIRVTQPVQCWKPQQELHLTKTLLSFWKKNHGEMGALGDSSSFQGLQAGLDQAELADRSWSDPGA